MQKGIELSNSTDKIHIIDAIKANDELVLKDLYLSSFRQVEIYIVQNSGTSQQAKDIYQEAFIVLWSNVKNGKFIPKTEKSIGGYLFNTAKYKWIDFLRSKEFQKNVQLDANNVVYEEPKLMKFHIEENEKIQGLEMALKQMGGECRKLLTDFYYHKKTMKWIAAKFNIGEASARNKKYRCLQKLKEIMLTKKQSKK